MWLNEPCQLAIVSIGYGDGYPRAFPKQNYVHVNGQASRVIGRVAMDMIAIDVTRLNAPVWHNCRAFWGKEHLVRMMCTEANGTMAINYLSYECAPQSVKRFKRQKIYF